MNRDLGALSERVEIPRTCAHWTLYQRISFLEIISTGYR
jgi:hypothetical protein